jgi:soluble lytic murein transglycosylase-like protein
MYKVGGKARRIWRRLSRRDWLMVLVGVVLAVVVVEAVSLIDTAKPAVPYQSAGVSATWIPSTVKHWDTPINQMAKRYNIDANLVAIIMTMESGGDAKAKSPDDAQGLMQVTPPTAKDIAAKYLKKPVSKYNLSDPATNIEFGVAYLAYLRDQFGTAKQGPSWDSSVELIAAGYNGGPGAANSLEQGKGLTDDQTIIYSRDAFNMWRERHASDSPTFDRWKERGGTVLLDAAKANNQ